MRPENDVAHPIHELLRHRWSPRAFDPGRSIDSATLRSLLEAARWTPSSLNEQPWRFLVARREDPAEFDRMLGCLNESNQVWATNAAVLMVAVAMNTFTRNEKPNRYAFYDTGAAVAYLTLEASARGLHVHQMGGFDVEKVRERYAVPTSADPTAALAIGYVGDPESLPERLRERELAPGQRRPIREFTFSGAWGQPAELAE